MRSLALFSAVCAAFALACGLYVAFAPDTGVTGTPGAWLVVAGAAACTLVALLRAFRWPGGDNALLLALCGIGMALTAIAAWFLMQPAIYVALAYAFVLWIAEIAIGGREVRA
ncbi:hypothetical protein [Wenxinia saemankumensis]|uniref:Uncharacterized protein n=1 Tax=Wenxinia saemankumensis TaxID=1447782 RepID=A0A1M6HAJ1_9RHOB|nr:hypothetical protein [Wenxinia saemankumensis]SHJ19252.1 hypothetical protein SAMN05444417_3123 [Wenxinia saemankumensis]